MTNKQAQITINAIKFMLDNAQYSEDVEEALNMAIYALTEQRWIPVTERLPEESRRYLISVIDGAGRRTTVAWYQPRYKAWTMTGRMAYWKVIAWMPLPEPYAERREECFIDVRDVEKS